MFSQEEKDALYKVIATRRDVRSFNNKPVPADAVDRILKAAHQAPSVGFMQPWNFILIDSNELKEKLAWAADKERRALAIHYEGDERASSFLKLKIEGIKEAPITICITCDPTRGGAHVLGRNSIPETDMMSTACAIQNMWLASCVEGIAMGWVSFYKKADIREILEIPPHIDPVALISLGYTDVYPKAPILESAKWEKRKDLQNLISKNKWVGPEK
ncbi:5,6-dimethylbenzimidazole synthase [Metabacillus halosaccharovorans]|uniref:5,6-dimethylbenzimidazole synthase n=1 Tax=Metabacillus halosaccharovorans TaxID=930124 RepID=A0ABT3DF12_9BACI|nr:5,6-dimethylbenzimidazole synthase [Metabacillus halosaccharovorans]MCV9885581.1 5,6-dimethylbenzimidazole synthase [Metabacillus halosaccharovorans]